MIVNEVVKPMNLFIRYHYFFIKSLVIVNTCKIYLNEKGKAKFAQIMKNINSMEEGKRKRILSLSQASYYHNSSTNQNKLISNMTLPMTESIDEGVQKTQSFNDNVHNLD